ncbi:MAG TPA: VIT domain-containing protein, partial [Polyangiaceae bacterium]|nr:VIT domain-containing protein [Polyangiaceae bacterium]
MSTNDTKDDATFEDHEESLYPDPATVVRSAPEEDIAVPEPEPSVPRPPPPAPPPPPPRALGGDGHGASTSGVGVEPEGGARAASPPPDAQVGVGSVAAEHASTEQAATEPEPTYPTTAPPPPVGPVHVGAGSKPYALFFLVATIVIAAAIATSLLKPPPKPLENALTPTIADLSPVHAGVMIGADPARELRRLGVGDVVETDDGGRARVRLDSGASFVLDGGTKLTLTETGVRLDSGRAFLLPGSTKPVEIEVGGAKLRAVDAAIGMDLRKGAKAYVASGEITANAGGKDVAVRTGETATLGGSISVAPERGFDDWTGGLAAPWAADGPPRRAVGEIWGRAQPGEAGSPLTIRTHEIHATVYGEVAETKIKTTFFNAGESTVMGDYRVGLPPRAIVSGFAVERAGQREVGHVMLADRKAYAVFDTVRASGTASWLEWAGEGWLRGTVPQIPAGQAVTVEIAYVEWLPVRV